MIFKKQKVLITFNASDEFLIFLAKKMQKILRHMLCNFEEGAPFLRENMVKNVSYIEAKNGTFWHF